MMALPAIPYTDRIRKKRTVKFGGYNHTAAAGDGDIYDMQNMTSDDYPLLSPRGKRCVLLTEAEPQGLYICDSLYYAAGDVFHDHTKGTSHPLEALGVVRRFCALNGKLVILPDKKVYDMENGIMREMEASVTAMATFTDGTYGGESAEANTIAASVAWADHFSVGDAVQISGSSVIANNTTLIIREIDGGNLRFYENSFTVTSAAASITVSRTVPDMDFICENENRLWGCKDDTIFACKLGDLFNWNVFDGLATDSYAVDVGSAGEFTACVSYRGYPIFFKEDKIYKVYGSKPSNFQVMGSASLGVAKGSDRSVAVAGETCFYLSRVGMVAYSGGIPQSIAEPFGRVRYKNAVAGSDGVKYYVSMEGEGGHTLFVFDTRHNIWEKEDGTEAVSVGWMEDLIVQDSLGRLFDRGGSGLEGEAEDTVASMVEFADFAEDDPNRKGVSKLQLRYELEATDTAGAALALFISYDGGAYEQIWQQALIAGNTEKKSNYIPVIPRRCDHFRLKLVGSGTWRLHSLVRESYSGSEIH